MSDDGSIEVGEILKVLDTTERELVELILSSEDNVAEVTEVRGESPAVHGGDEADKLYANHIRRAERMF